MLCCARTCSAARGVLFGHARPGAAWGCASGRFRMLPDGAVWGGAAGVASRPDVFGRFRTRAGGVGVRRCGVWRASGRFRTFSDVSGRAGRGGADVLGRAVWGGADALGRFRVQE